MREAWEHDLTTTKKKKSDEQALGCLNAYCCESSLYYVRKKFDNLSFFCFVLAFIGFINYCLMVNLISYIEIYSEKRLTHGLEETIIGGIMAFLTFISLAIAALGSGSGPSFNPFLEVKSELFTNPFAIDQRFIDFDGFFDIADIRIIENRKPCGHFCEDLEYKVEF